MNEYLVNEHWTGKWAKSSSGYFRCVSLEFLRRMNRKLEQNMSVYNTWLCTCKKLWFLLGSVAEISAENDLLINCHSFRLPWALTSCQLSNQMMALCRRPLTRVFPWHSSHDILLLRFTEYWDHFLRNFHFEKGEGVRQAKKNIHSAYVYTTI